MHVLLLKDKNFVNEDPQNFNNRINTCLITPKIILYYS